MARIRRANLYREVRELAGAYLEGRVDEVVKRMLVNGPKRSVLPALVYRQLCEESPQAANQFLFRIIDRVAD